MIPHTFRFAVVRLLFGSLVLASSTLNAQNITALWRTGATGNWNDPSRWNTKNFPNNNGAQSYAAFIDNGNVTLNQPIVIDELTLGETGVPTLQGINSLDVRSNKLDVLSNLVLNQGLITGKSTLNAFGTAEISGNTNLYGWRLTLSGYTNWSGRLGVGNASVIDNLAGATLDLSPGAVCTYYWPNSQNPNGGKRTLNNYGTINAKGGGVATLDLPLNNLGTINAAGGSLVLTCGGTHAGPINLANGATLSFLNSNIPTGPGYVFAESSSISGNGSVNFNAGNFVIHGNYDITGTTTVGGTVSFPSPIASLGSSLVVNGQFANCDLGTNSVTVSTLNLKNGTLTGSGTVTVEGPLEWNAGAMRGSGITNAWNGVFLNELNPTFGPETLDRTLNCYGSSSVQTTGPYMTDLRFGLNAALNIMPGAIFNGSRLGVSGSSTSGQINGTFTNYGTLVINDPGLNRGMFVSGTAFVNQGTIQVTNSMLDARAAVGQPAFVQNAGSIKLTNGRLHSDLSKINGGSLTGYGTVGSLVNNGVIAPSGTLTVLGTVNLQSDSVLAYDLNWDHGSLFYGYIEGYSSVTLGGALQIALSGEAQSHILPSQTFTVMSASSIGGQFTNVVSGGRLPTVDGGGSFIVTYGGTQILLSNFLPN